MKKISILIAMFAFLLIAVSAKAQLMDSSSATDISTKQGSQNEAAGQAVWNQLQNKQITCQSLQADDFDKLGDFFMGNMIGTNDDFMDQLMTQRLGRDGEKQMHIAMGERLSGCDSNAAFPVGGDYFFPMMGVLGGMMGGYYNNQPQVDNGFQMMGFSGSGNNLYGQGILGMIAAILIIVFLILGIVYFWQGITNRK